jgi:hypothetical protein
MHNAQLTLMFHAWMLNELKLCYVFFGVTKKIGCRIVLSYPQFIFFDVESFFTY